MNLFFSILDDGVNWAIGMKTLNGNAFRCSDLVNKSFNRINFDIELELVEEYSASRGFSFIWFKTREDAEKCMEFLQKTLRHLEVF